MLPLGSPFLTVLSCLGKVKWCHFFFFNRSLLEYNCFTILCQFLLYTKVNQPFAYICPCIPSLLSLPPILPIPPLQVIAKLRADLPVLCCCFPLAILRSVVYICRCYSHFAPAFPSHPMSSSPFSMSTSLFLPCNQVHQYHIFFYIPYICVSIRYLFSAF